MIYHNQWVSHPRHIDILLNSYQNLNKKLPEFIFFVASGLIPTRHVTLALLVRISI